MTIKFTGDYAKLKKCVSQTVLPISGVKLMVTKLHNHKCKVPVLRSACLKRFVANQWRLS